MNILTHIKALELYTFNIPARKCCPGMSKACAKYCMAQKGNFLYKNVRKAASWKLSLTKRADFIGIMSAELGLAALRGHKLFRLHSSGDFYDVGYITKWIKIAKKVPEVKILAYTKS